MSSSSLAVSGVEGDRADGAGADGAGAVKTHSENVAEPRLCGSLDRRM